MAEAKEPFVSYSHWTGDTHDLSEAPIERLGLVCQPDGKWEVGCQFPWEEVLSEFEETCDMEGRRFVLVSLLDPAQTVIGHGADHEEEE